VRGLSPNEQAQAAGAQYVAATAQMTEYLQTEIAARRSKPRDDLLTGLLNAEVDGQHLSFEETLGFFQLLLVAGQETTANLISNAIVCLLDHPQEMARLRARIELLPSAIEEVLRYRSPVQWMFRATRRDVQLDGTTIPAKKLILTVIGSANRDPRVFPDPDRFDIARDPNPHIAFGHGGHFCLGAALARMEARIALTDLLTRLRDIEPATTEPWPPRKALHVHGPSHLHLRYARNTQQTIRQ
jgi:cytochrome P450